MGRAYGARPDRPMGRDLGLPPVDRPGQASKAGQYPKKENFVGQYGTRAYPSLIESYNRDSDYKRWRMGQDLYYNASSSWTGTQIRSLSRFFLALGSTDEILPRGSRDIVTTFPSGTSPEGVWYCSTRTRGSIILPLALDDSMISLDQTSEDPSQHRLLIDCSAFYTEAQVRAFETFVGDQFEDSANSPVYPSGLIERPIGSTAMTLVEANGNNRTLVFDISKAYTRIEINKLVYWHPLTYKPEDPKTFVFDGSRHICSSFKFFCCCPDHMGGSVANLEAMGGGLQQRFPMPPSGRTTQTEWERENSGYIRQWRNLPTRRDERRECKHVHALRWECGVPWMEPSDYPTEESRLRFAEAVQFNNSEAELKVSYASVSRSQATWSRYILSLADTVGIQLFPRGGPRDSIRFEERPLLWNDSRQPQADWCRLNDWWVERGTKTLKVFDAVSGTFQERISKFGIDYEPVTIVDASNPDAPVIVR
jgi:hypothetical protein